MNPDAARSSAHSLQMILNPQVFENDQTLVRIGESLVAGKLVVVRNAMRETFAERMFRCLDEFSAWRLYEDYQDHFHYHHHNIYDKGLYPPDLARCNAIFAGDGTKALIQQLSDRDCSGETSFSASWYQPGDHSLPHNDDNREDPRNNRQVAFVWHLTKDWNSKWGGDLYWCAAERSVMPSFNTLALFTVGPDSTHFVTHVAPIAAAKRLAINGWWTGVREPRVKRRNEVRSAQVVEIG